MGRIHEATARWLVGIGIGVFTIALAAALWILAMGPLPSVDWSISEQTKLEYYKLLLTFIQLLVGGVTIGAVAVIIPAYLTNQKERIDRAREARTYYTEASVGVRYMPERLSVLTLADGFALISSIHSKKHLSEVHYYELWRQLRWKRDVQYLMAGQHWTKLTKRWSDDMFSVLEGYDSVLRSRLGDWESLSVVDKFSLLTRFRDDLDDQRRAEDVAAGLVTERSKSRGLLI
jgi:hypothetical protein